MNGKRAKQQRKVAHQARVRDVVALASLHASSGDEVMEEAGRLWQMSDEQLARIAKRELVQRVQGKGTR